MALEDKGDMSGPPSRFRRAVVSGLLLLPLLAVVCPPLYNSVDPRLAGIPFFYWYQLSMIPFAVACTLLAAKTGRR